MRCCVNAVYCVVLISGHRILAHRVDTVATTPDEIDQTY